MADEQMDYLFFTGIWSKCMPRMFSEQSNVTGHVRQVNGTGDFLPKDHLTTQILQHQGLRTLKAILFENFEDPEFPARVGGAIHKSSNVVPSRPSERLLVDPPLPGNVSDDDWFSMDRDVLVCILRSQSTCHVRGSSPDASRGDQGEA